MFNVLAEINWLAVAAATFAFSALGALWFTLLVPKYYAISLGREKAPRHQQSGRDYLVQVLCTLATTITSAILIYALKVDGVGSALTFGAIVGLGFLVSMTFNIATNPNFPRPLMYGLVNGPFFFIGSLMTSVILVLMR